MLIPYALVATVVTGYVMLVDYPQQRTVQFLLLAGAASLLLVAVVCRPRKVAAYSADQYYPTVPQYFGTGPNNRPVMFYDGEVYDFVHNDPTAPSTK